MKKPAQQQAMTIRSLFNREFDGKAWHYHDQEEAEFAFIVWPDYSLTSIDDFIEGRQGLALTEQVIDELTGIRHDAFQAFKAKNFDLMMAYFCRPVPALCMAQLGGCGKKFTPCKNAAHKLQKWHIVTRCNCKKCS